MMKTVELLCLLAIIWGVDAFTKEEFQNFACSFPDEYSHRLINCTMGRSSTYVQKTGELLDRCVDKFYETETQAESFLLFLCRDEVFDSEDVHHCLQEGIEDVEDPNEEDLEIFIDAAKYCLIFG
ncbi:uncharacterized protein [Centruroides vittatus]|uniref:uncharacterized protein n=1 Tax=Centruroides vittatus TaxID=120091 RepID=UPI00351036B5